MRYSEERPMQGAYSCRPHNRYLMNYVPFVLQLAVVTVVGVNVAALLTCVPVYAISEEMQTSQQGPWKQTTSHIMDSLVYPVSNPMLGNWVSADLDTKHQSCSDLDTSPKPCSGHSIGLKPCSERSDVDLKPCSDLDVDLKPCSDLDVDLKPCSDLHTSCKPCNCSDLHSVVKPCNNLDTDNKAQNLSHFPETKMNIKVEPDLICNNTKGAFFSTPVVATLTQPVTLQETDAGNCRCFFGGTSKEDGSSTAAAAADSVACGTNPLTATDLKGKFALCTCNGIKLETDSQRNESDTVKISSTVIKTMTLRSAVDSKDIFRNTIKVEESLINTACSTKTLVPNVVSKTDTETQETASHLPALGFAMDTAKKSRTLSGIDSAHTGPVPDKETTSPRPESDMEATTTGSVLNVFTTNPGSELDMQATNTRSVSDVLTINSGSGSAVISINSVSVSDVITINSGSGSDVITINSGSESDAVTVSSGSGSDVLTSHNPGPATNTGSVSADVSTINNTGAATNTGSDLSTINNPGPATNTGSVSGLKTANPGAGGSASAVDTFSQPAARHSSPAPDPACERPCVCDLCEAAFTCLGHLNRHRLTHRGEKPFSCPDCGAAFSQHTDVKIHQRIHSGERPYMCEQCAASFMQSSHLTSHMRVHTGERPYMCKACNARFTKSGDLTRHLMRHRDEKPFTCHDCQISFTRHSSLKRHITRHGSKRKMKKLKP